MQRIALAVSLTLISAISAAQPKTGAKAEPSESKPTTPDAGKTGAILLTESVIIEVDGTETKLPPGSFYFMKGKKPHIARCDTTADCVVTVNVRGIWDAISVKK